MIRNEQGIWINPEAFREAGAFFQKYGYYNADPVDSPAWLEYWSEQRRRCREGYSVGGAQITGDHYFYLNFCPILKADIISASTGGVTNKIEGFPDFWDGDYNYFWAREIARNGIVKGLRLPAEEQVRINNLDEADKITELTKLRDLLHLEVEIHPKFLEGGKDLILGKARRKGYSYKNGSIAVCNYFHRPKSYTMFMAYEKKYLYPNGIFNMSKNYISFVNDHTAWSMPSDFVNKQDHIRSSYKIYKEGVEIERGFKSEIQAISFKDNPDAGRGKNCYDIIGEEVGAWGVPGGLKATLGAMAPSVTAGIYRTGMITLFGTSGDIEKGTVDFADLHRNPIYNNFLPFYDNWGKYPDKVEGFFHPVQWNMEGHYDLEGNSNLETAKEAELIHRKELIAEGATTSVIRSRMQEYPTDSSEAFSLVSKNTFPGPELQAQLDKLEAHKWHETKAMPVKLYYNSEGKVIAEPVLDLVKAGITVLDSYLDTPFNKEGCIVIYEQPVENAPRGLYKIGYDPVRHQEGESLAAIIVYKGIHMHTPYHDTIVAEYVGRHQDPEKHHKLAMLLADYYNTQIMHENEVADVTSYFKRIKRTDVMCVQPDRVINKSVKNSRTNRSFGCHMPKPLKDVAAGYVSTWLDKVVDYDEEGNPITTIDRIYSRRLLQELINYHPDGNFDLVSALFMAMFQIQEEDLGKIHTEAAPSANLDKLREMRRKMYRKKTKLRR